MTRLTFERAAGDFVPAWSPDGRRIVFASIRDGSVDIFTMRADGSNQAQPGQQPVIRRRPRLAAAPQVR